MLGLGAQLGVVCRNRGARPLQRLGDFIGALLTLGCTRVLTLRSTNLIG
jgi:hypothetical protein